MSEKLSKRSRRDDHTEATRQALLAAGQESFATQGYQATGIEGISQAARVTRGAFYHHFKDKKALFDAVVVAMQAEAASGVSARARKKESIWDRLSEGIEAYLDACLVPAYCRIVIQEAPAVLGSERFQEIEETYPMALLVSTLNALHRRGELDFENTELLSRMLDAMICKVALMLPKSDNPKQLREEGKKVIDGFLDGFRGR